MSIGFFSKVDLLKDIELEKESLLSLTPGKKNKIVAKDHEKVEERKVKEINYDSEKQAAAFVEDKLPCPHPGSYHIPIDPIHKNLKVENGLFGTKINGHVFDDIKENMDEYER